MVGAKISARTCEAVVCTSGIMSSASGFMSGASRLRPAPTSQRVSYYMA